MLIERIIDQKGEPNQRPDTGPCGYTYYVSEPRYGCDPVGDLLQGQRLAGRFTVKSCLGRGSLGAVYLAYDDLRSIDVAVKVVPIISEQIADQLGHEIRHNSMITNYEHVIHVYDIHKDRRGGFDLLLISMEYADGGSLRQWLVQNRNNVLRRRMEGPAYVLQACKGLQALHQAGILHLDVKPENILSVKGVPKIADFGLSRFVKDIGRSGDTSIAIGKKSWVGTPAYMSPEQLMPAYAERVDVRSDIYSMGAILFETCDEQCAPPFAGSYDEIREAHFHMPAPQIGEVEAHIARAISRCLQKDPADRYADVSRLIDELEGCDSAQDGPPENTQGVQETDQLWSQACEFVQLGNLNSAGRICTEILDRCPKHSDAKYLLQDIQDRFEQARQIYATIRDGIGRRPLSRLLTLLTAAVQTYPDHPDGPPVQIELISVTEDNELVMRNAVIVLRKGYWQAALNGFERVNQLNPGQLAVTEAIGFIKDVQREIQTARANIDAAIEQGNVERALQLARNLDKYIAQAIQYTECLQPLEVNHETRTPDN